VTEESIRRPFCQSRQNQRPGLYFKKSSSNIIMLAGKDDLSFFLAEILIPMKVPAVDVAVLVQW